MGLVHSPCGAAADVAVLLHRRERESQTSHLNLRRHTRFFGPSTLNPKPSPRGAAAGVAVLLQRRERGDHLGGGQLEAVLDALEHGVAACRTVVYILSRTGFRVYGLLGLLETVLDALEHRVAVWGLGFRDGGVSSGLEVLRVQVWLGLWF